MHSYYLDIQGIYMSLLANKNELQESCKAKIIQRSWQGVVDQTNNDATVIHYSERCFGIFKSKGFTITGCQILLKATNVDTAFSLISQTHRKLLCCDGKVESSNMKRISLNYL